MSCHLPQGSVLDGKRHVKNLGCLAFRWNVDGCERFQPVLTYQGPTKLGKCLVLLQIAPTKVSSCGSLNRAASRVTWRGESLGLTDGP